MGHAIPVLHALEPRTPELLMEPNHAPHHPSLQASPQELPAPHQVKTEPTHATLDSLALVPRTPEPLMEPNHAPHHPSLKASPQELPALHQVKTEPTHATQDSHAPV